MARKYAFLSFAPGIDWKDVDPELLARANRLGMKLGQIITVTSGHRSYGLQQRLYARYVASGYDPKYIAAKPGHSEHEKLPAGAIDAFLGGKPIAKAVDAKTLASVGLSAPVKGDWEHLQLAAGGKPTKAAATSPASDQSVPPVTQLGTMAQPDVTLPAYQPPIGAPPGPLDSLAQAAAPGTGGAGINPDPDPAQAWQQIASQPMADPVTGTYSQQVAVALGKG